MGQEIERIRFTPADFERFRRRVAEETHLLRVLEHEGHLSGREPVGGFEIEAWLVDRRLRPAPDNVRYLKALADPLASAELARFNVELNNRPRPLREDALRRFHHDLAQLWRRADACARRLDLALLMIGILPTLRQADLSLANMSPLNRYLALNEQILKQRGGQPLRLDIHGLEHLRCLHHDVMLESAATSFQIHLQAPRERAVALYNASIVASAATVAAGANSPFLFGRDLWAETRIPLFEQAIEVGGYGAAVRGPLRRVGFGSGYARRRLSEVFEENLRHFPPLLPICFDTPPEKLAHLRLHNGTIWRWNRPLVGFDADGTPHFRIEHRVLPAGPTLVDMIANAALYYGLAESLSHEKPLPFAVARDNFYRAAKHGWEARVIWAGGQRWHLSRLLRDELIPLAREGLQRLGICRRDREFYLDIVRQRVLADQNGALWQRRFAAVHGRDFIALTAAYLRHQRQGDPVHTWPI
ncbi:hypothetical protein MIN45_P0722 [Methylomarinovum tepidoasis]|uniref:Glutamate--cysteine ligase n=1 Tax=Methylomarinovum tepidoasis TaxID=2840183 RepID=A0AAU9CPV3_9GAMM|nr:glutamate--cysteine ligase [Methylomarinovum sp. IN45]BCX88353.1 hypothetical protein MIN45_P0722 [Methylomarinovum sp. IN45]